MISYLAGSVKLQNKVQDSKILVQKGRIYLTRSAVYSEDNTANNYVLAISRLKKKTEWLCLMANSIRTNLNDAIVISREDLVNDPENGLFPLYFSLDNMAVINEEEIETEIGVLKVEALKRLRKFIIFTEIKDYYNDFHKATLAKVETSNSKINYSGRVYDEKELIYLVDSSLDFWLTSGRYAEKLETGLREFLGVKYCALVNSGSSANLLAFSALTSPKLG